MKYTTTMKTIKTLISGPVLLMLAGLANAAPVSDCVVLLHGLGRTELSMSALENRLITAGFQVVNLGYPSREHPIPELAEQAIGEGMAACGEHAAGGVNFVTHSLGSILVRYYFSHHTTTRPGRVVMMGPPNQGSEVVDALHDFPGFDLVNGPSGDQLGTTTDSVPLNLGPVDYEVGIIAGSQSLNPVFAWLLPGQDDGKVSVESTRLEGMSSHKVLPVTHTWMMYNDDVIDQVVHFLKTGAFYD